MSEGLLTALISAGTTITVLLLTGIGRLIYFRYSLNYRLRREYNFDQKKNIKITLAATKTPLIKAAEELNYRLWNLSRNISERWHNVPEEKWTESKRYYLKSTVYRFLHFIYWTLEAEDAIYSFDFAQADKHDKTYLKFIKTLKHFFCESDLLQELNYNGSKPLNHFYKDNLRKYAFYLRENDKVRTFEEFESKFDADYNPIKEVVEYMSNIENSGDNLNYSTIKAFHLFLMIFLNKYGLDYHETKRKKFRDFISNNYTDFRIKNGLKEFIVRNKVVRESKWIINDLGLKQSYHYIRIQ